MQLCPRPTRRRIGFPGHHSGPGFGSVRDHAIDESAHRPPKKVVRISVREPASAVPRLLRHEPRAYRHG
jgi:hypothetical protein